MYNAAVYQCGLGLLVMGTNSQGGTAIGCEIMSNGYDPWQGQILPRGNGGTGVYDRGNGANNWIGCATEANTGRAFVAATSNAASTVLGCYIEARQQPSYLGAAAFKIGSQGDDAPNSPGWIVNGSQAVGPFAVPNPMGNQVSVDLGLRDTSDAVMVWKTDQEGGYTQMGWSEDDLAWATDWHNAAVAKANVFSRRISYITGTRNQAVHPRNPGLPGFEDVLLGTTQHNVRLSPGSPFTPQNDPQAPPPKGSGPWQVGDRILNTKPSAANPFDGWICTDASTDPGTWVPYGRIEFPPP